MTAPVLEVQGLKKYFPVSTGGLLHRRTGWVKAVETRGLRHHAAARRSG